MKVKKRYCMYCIDDRKGNGDEKNIFKVAGY